MSDKPKEPPKPPTPPSPEFEKAIQAMANTPPVSNDEIAKKNKNNK